MLEFNMWKNFLLTGFRNLKRNRVFSFINIIGLAIGITSLLLVGIFARHELSYDRFHENSDRTFRLLTLMSEEDGYSSSTSTEVADRWFPQIPGIEAKTFLGRGRLQVFVDNSTFDQRIRFADPSFFEIFSTKIVHGDKKEFLNDPNTVILSRDAAIKYFNNEDVVGRTLEVKLFGEVHDLIVKGVIEPLPANSSIKFDMILPFKHKLDRMKNLNASWNRGSSDLDLWNFVFSNTYILLEDGIDPAEFEKNLRTIPYVDTENWEKDPSHYKIQPITSQHLILFNKDKLSTKTDGSQLMILVGIGLVILILACINFATLTIGRATTRQREIGVRKVLGAAKFQLHLQIWIETMLIGAVALIPALVLTDLALPYLANITDAELVLTWDIQLIAILFGVYSTAVLIAGLYPTFVLTSFPLLDALKGKFGVKGKGRLRKGLLYVQLSTSITLCTIALIMMAQLNFVQNQNLGFDCEQVISLDASSENGLAMNVLEKLRGELAGDPGILNITATSCNFGPSWNMLSWLQVDNPEKEDSYWQNTVDPEFLSTVRIPIIEGRDFRAEDDPNKVMIVNQAFVDMHQISDPIGWSMPERFSSAEIIGVTDNFYFHDLTKEVQPVILTLTDEVVESVESISIEQHDMTPGYILVRLAPNTVHETIDRINEAWLTLVPEAAFKLTFAEEKIEKQYAEFGRWNRVVTFATLLSIVIALLGIIGMSVLQVAQRTKEIGIRKVCGASIKQILALLTKETGIIVLTSNILALPIAWIFIQKWLQNFALKISPNVFLLGTAGSLMLIMTIATVAILSWKTASDNPSLSLRND
jgi:putative ABC transport system permease protein